MYLILSLSEGIPPYIETSQNAAQYRPSDDSMGLKCFAHRSQQDAMMKLIVAENKAAFVRQITATAANVTVLKGFTL